MPNYCQNDLEISGHPILMEEFMKSYTNDGHFDFAKITPMPSDEELQDMGINSYSWAIENWGQKWYVDKADWEDWDNTYYRATFDTAWSPCIPVIKKLIDLCPGLDFTFSYSEPGCAFLGWIYASDGEIYEEVEVSYSDDPADYWYHMFDKEYECFEWLSDRLEEMHDDNEITDEVFQELQSSFINDSLEIMIGKFLQHNIL